MRKATVFSTKNLTLWRKGKTLIMYFVLLYPTLKAHGEPEFSKRYGPPIQRRFRSDLSALFNDNSSNPTASAKEYLGKFGWVEPPDWTAVSPRFNESISEGGSVGNPIHVLTEMSNEPSNETKIEYLVKERFEALSDHQFEEALKNFQQANGLVVTGRLDESTIFVMTQPRCGVPDQTAVAPLNHSSANIENTTAPHDDIISGFSSGDGDLVNTSDIPNPSTPRHKRSTLGDSVDFAYQEYYDEYGLPLITNIQEATENAKAESLLANFVTEDVVLEAELSHSTRVESMESILMALRAQKSNPNGEETARREVSADPFPRQTSLVSRIVTHVRGNERRKKRSLLYTIFQRNGWGMPFTKKTITWRLVKEWPTMNPSMTVNEVWFTVKLGFRMWSEILPRNFLEDNTSPIKEVDILIGFGSKRHNRCPVEFRKGPFMQEYAHAWPLPMAEVHFNDDQPFVPVSWEPTAQHGSSRQSSKYPISLLKVAVHEIGHTLGLPHSENRVSVMNPYYKPFKSKDAVELGPSDRQSIKRIYGPCAISFDAVFDWVRQVRTQDGVLRWKFNTYFFRKSWYWLYDNRSNHPRYGDPKLISQYWPGVMDPSVPHQELDGIVHVREWGTPHGPTFFFKGDTYIEYDNINDRAKLFDKYGQRYPRKIAVDFPGIPFPIDTVFYKWDEELLYFFKGNYVYKFRWKTRTLESFSLISDAFPGWGGASPLPGNIDSTYYSYTKRSFYFFKGIYFWKMAGPTEKYLNIGIEFKHNAVGPKQKISDYWRDLCDVEPTELIMTLPTT